MPSPCDKEQPLHGFALSHYERSVRVHLLPYAHLQQVLKLRCPLIEQSAVPDKLLPLLVLLLLLSLKNNGVL